MNRRGPLTPGRALAFAALAVFVGDGLFATVYWALSGATPDRVFQGVAAGLLGREAFEGGLPTALLGVALHLFNATAIAAIYHLASRRLAFLNRRPVVWGILYGVGVYLVMTYVVIPLSAARSGAFDLRVFSINVAAHIVFVGLPCALLARAAAPGTSR